MARFVKGDVVVVPFPFSDLSNAKRRPAMIAAELEGEDLILCQITSQRIRDRFAIFIGDEDFETGGLKEKQRKTQPFVHGPSTARVISSRASQA